MRGREDTGARITISDTVQGFPDRLVAVTGLPQVVCDAVSPIVEKLEQVFAQLYLLHIMRLLVVVCQHVSIATPYCRHPFLLGWDVFVCND